MPIARHADFAGFGSVGGSVRFCCGAISIANLYDSTCLACSCFCSCSIGCVQVVTGLLFRRKVLQQIAFHLRLFVFSLDLVVQVG